MPNLPTIEVYAEVSDHAEPLKYNWLLQATNGSDISIPAFLDTHAFEIRRQYLAFVHELSQEKIGDKTLATYFTIRGGYDLWQMGLIAEKNLVKSANISNCLKLLALEKLIVRDAVKKVKLICTDTLIGTAIEQLCQTMQIGIEWENKNAATGKQLRYKRFSQLVQAMGTLFLICREGFLLRKIRAPHWFTGEQSLFVFSYFFNMDLQKSNVQGAHSPYWEILPDFLRKHNIKTNWLNFFIADKNFPNPVSAMAFAERINKNSDNERHSFFTAYLSIKQAMGCWMRYMYYWFKGYSLNPSLLLRSKQSAASFATLLWEDWERSAYGSVLMQNLLWVSAFDKAIGTLPKQKAGLYLQENTAWEPAFIHAWRRYGHGTIIGVAHATIRFWDLRYFHDSRIFMHSPRNLSTGYRPRPDRTAVNGPIAFSNLEASGQPREEIVPVEGLRYLQPPLKHTHTIPSQKMILICGDIDPASTMAMLHCLEQAIAMVSEEERNNTKFFFKHHPACLIPLDTFQIPRCEIFAGSMQQGIRQSQILIAPDSTTAAVEGFEEGLAVILFNFSDRVNFSPLMGVKQVFFVSSPGEMAKMIAQVTIAHKGNKEPFFWKDENLPKWLNLLSQTGYAN